jgi:hypothetical protein
MEFNRKEEEMNVLKSKSHSKRGFMKKVTGELYLLVIVAMLVQMANAQAWTFNGPQPRSAHAAVQDPTTKQMIIFGGFPSDTTSQQNLNDVWRLIPPASLSGTLNWIAVHPSGTPPAPRFGMASGYDPGTNEMIIFGGATGRSSPCASDVWTLTNAAGTGGASWGQLSPVGAPPSRHSTGGVYDPISNTLMIYGGNNCFNTTFSDFWVLSHANGQGGTPTWTQLFPAGGPGPRQVLNSVVYDPSSNEFILFGGASGSGTDFNDVWVLSNANGTGGTPAWTQLSPTGTLPQVRNGQSAIYDPSSNRLTIFGGGNSSGFFDDTWVLTNANGQTGTPAWSQIAQSPNFPNPRAFHTAVYNSGANVMTIFSGAFPGGNQIGANDVLFLSHANGQ